MYLGNRIQYEIHEIPVFGLLSGLLTAMGRLTRLVLTTFLAASFAFVIFYIPQQKSTKLSISRKDSFFSGFPGWLKRPPQNGTYTLPCSRILLENGTMVGKTWIPERRCPFNRYTKKELLECIKLREKVPNPDMWFLGDSRMRNEYASFLWLFLNESFKASTTKDAWYETMKTGTKNGRWYTTKLWPTSPVYGFASREFLPDMHKDLNRLLAMPEEARPSFLFMGSAVHYPRRSKNTNMYQSDFKKILPLIRKVTSNDVTKVIWKLDEPVNRKQMRPVYPQTNDLLYKLSCKAQELLNGTGVHIWRSLIPIFMAYQDWWDGMHLGNESKTVHAMVIANMYCQDIGAPWKPPS